MTKRKITLYGMRKLVCKTAQWPTESGKIIYTEVDLSSLLADVKGGQKGQGIPMGIHNSYVVDHRLTIRFIDILFGLKAKDSR